MQGAIQEKAYSLHECKDEGRENLSDFREGQYCPKGDLAFLGATISHALKMWASANLRHKLTPILGRA